jgi:DNA-binding CsgD family transcriptional regulator
MARDLLAALPAIYDAATSDDKWPAALDALVSAVDARGAILMAFDLVGLPFQVQKWCTSYRDDDIHQYFTRFGHYEDKGVELLRKSPARTFVRDTAAWPNYAEIADREDVVFLRERYGVQHRGAVCLTKDKGWSDSLALQVCEDWPNVTNAFWENLELSLPHMAKVVEINRTFTLLRLRYQAVLSALDHIRIGMCIGLAGGQILVANEEARRIFAAGDGLGLGPDGRLRAREEDVTRQIRAAIELTARTADGEGSSNELSIACARTSQASPLLIEVCPLRDSKGELERGLLGSLVSIIDPDRTKDISTEGLVALFGLSPAEKSVCDELLRGRSARDVADMRNVSPETVRTQVKALYAKTGVANRVELIRLAIAANPPIG